MIDINQHIANLQSYRAFDDEATKILIAVGNDLLGSILVRITMDGKSSNSTKIGQYSMVPMWATKEMFITKSGFKPEAKAGGETITYNISNRKRENAKVTKDFREPKTMYLPGGYKQLRDIQGRQTAFVNLLYRGDLVSDFQMIRDGRSVVIGFRTERQSIKRKALEKKYNQPIFQGTRTEIETTQEYFAAQFNLMAFKMYSRGK